MIKSEGYATVVVLMQQPQEAEKQNRPQLKAGYDDNVKSVILDDIRWYKTELKRESEESGCGKVKKMGLL